MKRYILSAVTLLIAATAVAPAAQALDTQTSLGRQVSTPAELSEDATFHDLVRHNRRARNKS
ncbi:MAG: hypothetical protein AAFN42_23450 [Cyanobacteria bacterium J06554_1]